MGSEYIGPSPDPDKRPSPTSTNQPFDFPGQNSTIGQATHAPAENDGQFAETSYREHGSRPLVTPYPGAPYYPYQPKQPAMPAQHAYGPLYPAYNPATAQQAYGQSAQAPMPPYPGYYIPAGHNLPPGPYPGYGYPPYYPYYQYPPRPRRDGYLLGMAIASFTGSIIVVLTGFLCLLGLLLTVLSPANRTTAPGAAFSGIVMFTVLTFAGLGGGGFSVYHSIRSLFLKKRSAAFKLPQFWIFFALYVALIVTGFVIRNNGQAFSSTPLIIFLIILAGVLPAFSIFALAVRRLRSPDGKNWPTTWRRFTIAIVSGATSAIIFATIFELILTLFVTLAFHLNSFALDDPNMPTPHDPRVVAYLLIIVSLIAPLVEETVKPLAVVSFIGRMNSAAEAFVLGMACGIGFDLIETSGYISQGYHDWLDVALQRSTAGLLHGFGAGMVALGWYYLTHKNSANHRILLGLSCGLYAVLQHAIWNGSFVFQLLPAPIGPYLESGVIMIGSYPLQASLLVYIVESLLMLTFFLFVTGKLRTNGQYNKPAANMSQPAQEAVAYRA